MNIFRKIRYWWQMRKIKKNMARSQRKLAQQKLDDHHNTRCISIPVVKDDVPIDDAADALYESSSALEKLDRTNPTEVLRFLSGDWNSDSE